MPSKLVFDSVPELLGRTNHLQGQAQKAAKRLFELLSERQRDLYMVSPRYGRAEKRKDYRNGYYERDFVTRFGTLRLRIARTRRKGFLPEC